MAHCLRNWLPPIPTQQWCTSLGPPTFWDAAYGQTFFVDGKRVADIKDGTFTIIRFRPGQYRINTERDPQFSSSEGWPSETQLSVEAGHRYFVELYREIRGSDGLMVVGTMFIPSQRYEVIKRELRSLSQTDALFLLSTLRFEAPTAQSVP